MKQDNLFTEKFLEFRAVAKIRPPGVFLLAV